MTTASCSRFRIADRGHVVNPLARGMGRLALVVIATGVAGMDVAGQTPVAVADSSAIEGIVYGRFQGGVRALPYAVVEISAGGTLRRTVADSVGAFRVSALPAGQLRLTALHPAHESVWIGAYLRPGRTLTVDLELRASPLRLEGVDVSTEGSAEIRDPDPVDMPVSPPDPTVEVRLLEVGPGIAQSGLLGAVQSLPGQDPSDPSDVLFMRGSTTDLKLVLLDGVPVFTPFHVAGLMRSFEPSVLSSADLLVGGAPARYDGGLTHILDLTTRRARRDRVHAAGSLDMMTASAAVEIPLSEKAGALVSARGLHDLGQAPLGGERPYGYRDVLASVDGEPAEGHHLALTAFDNAESVLLDFPVGSSDAMWRNRALSVRYRADLGGARLRFTGGGSEYDAELPLRPAPREDNPIPEAVLASAYSERYRMVGSVEWGRPDASNRTGVSYENLAASFSATTFSGDRTSANGGRTDVVGAFFETSRLVAPGVTVRAGLRGDLFGGDDPRLGPRAAVFWDVGPAAMLTIAAGRYHQIAHAPQGEVDESITDFANQVPTTNGLLPVATADHVLLSLEQRLGTGVSLGLEGFWKRFDGLAGSDGEPVLNSGVDLRILSARERSTFWLGYGLSWFWSPLDLTGRATDFSGRHLLSAGLSGPIAGRLDGEVRVAYGAGLPSTSLPFGSAQGDALAAPAAEVETLSGTAVLPPPPVEPSFLRIDVEVQALFEPVIAGRQWRVRPYLRVLNALDRRDALFYTYQPWRSSSVTPLAERPLLPVLGVAFSF